jgi:hypothetical protein
LRLPTHVADARAVQIVDHDPYDKDNRRLRSSAPRPRVEAAGTAKLPSSQTPRSHRQEVSFGLEVGPLPWPHRQTSRFDRGRCATAALPSLLLYTRGSCGRRISPRRPSQGDERALVQGSRASDARGWECDHSRFHFKHPTGRRSPPIRRLRPGRVQS